MTAPIWHHGVNATKNRACAGKKTHRTMEKAQAERRRLIAEGAVNLVAYPCKHGTEPHYHVGHRPGSRRKR